MASDKKWSDFTSKEKLRAVLTICFFFIAVVSIVSVILDDKDEADVTPANVDIYSAMTTDEKQFFKTLEAITLTEQVIKNLSNDCQKKFNTALSATVYEVEALKPVIDRWSVEIFFNYQTAKSLSPYQYSCLYTKRGELLNTIHVNQDGVNVKNTDLQRKYNF